MLKDLRNALSGKQGVPRKVQRAPNPDNQIAVNMVEILYGHINKSIKLDRSEVKLNMLEKGGISMGIQRVLPGTKDYIEHMYPTDIKELLDDLEKELKKRRK